jgi:hypothetical protein
MKNQILIMGVLSGLLGLLGCNSETTDKSSHANTSSSQKIDLDNALFTTPTLENALPPFKEKTDSCASFHEDEWRQIEFISKDQKESIDKEIVKIKDIYDNYSHKGNDYIAFKKVAVRNLITQPLAINFTKLKSYLSDKEIKFQGLELQNNPGQVKGGYFFTVDGVNYYGLVDNNIVSSFCIYSADSNQQLKAAGDKLAKFLEKENLYLVDWRAMHVFDEKNIKTDLVKDTQ